MTMRSLLFHTDKKTAKHAFISNQGTSLIGEALKLNTSLTHLDLGIKRLYFADNYSSDTGVSVIAEAVKVNTSLTKLNLGCQL